MKAIDIINQRIKNKSPIQKVATLMAAGGNHKNGIIYLPDGRYFTILQDHDNFYNSENTIHFELYRNTDTDNLYGTDNEHI
jgi:hypothetical protein